MIWLMLWVPYTIAFWHICVLFYCTAIPDKRRVVSGLSQPDKKDRGTYFRHLEHQRHIDAPSHKRDSTRTRHNHRALSQHTHTHPTAFPRTVPPLTLTRMPQLPLSPRAAGPALSTRQGARSRKQGPRETSGRRGEKIEAERHAHQIPRQRKPSSSAPGKTILHQHSHTHYIFLL